MLESLTLTLKHEERFEEEVKSLGNKRELVALDTGHLDHRFGLVEVFQEVLETIRTSTERLTRK